jgi:hypothetical protein
LVARPHACITCASRVLEHSRPLIAQGCDRLVSKSGVHDADVPEALLIPSYGLSWLESLVMRWTKNRSALRHIGRTPCCARYSTGVNGRMLEVKRARRSTGVNRRMLEVKRAPRSTSDFLQ